MKIGILTQPLHTNYGGLVQAFALQAALKSMGHGVWTVDIPFRHTLMEDSKAAARRFVLKYLRRQKIGAIFPDRPGEAEDASISQHTRRFIEQNITVTERIPRVEDLGRLSRYHFDAYVVGSDQIWRAEYSPGIPTFFLEFLGDDRIARRVAYAASFGVDHWEFSDKLTTVCRSLAQRFDAISVREDSGVELCSQYLGVSAQHVVDPTMLLERSQYVDLVVRDGVRRKDNTLMAYVLDRAPEKSAMITSIATALDKQVNSVMPGATYSRRYRERVQECVFPPVTEWLGGFMDADFVLTDSFHGTVFSILFNKPFIALGNSKRGLTRFTSLLKMFDLEDRLITDLNEVPEGLLGRPIDFETVNRRIEEERRKAFGFLREALASPNVKA